MAIRRGYAGANGADERPSVEDGFDAEKVEFCELNSAVYGTSCKTCVWRRRCEDSGGFSAVNVADGELLERERLQKLFVGQAARICG